MLIGAFNPMLWLNVRVSRLVHHAILIYCHGIMGSAKGSECAGLTDLGGIPGVEGSAFST